ncbi:ATP-binding cassette domain-containing protein [Fusobacterium sp. PH5-44]|uniref:ATP-binding cassette domain-containing protein n=1 Tax=unclassified Fusobacterium TaxID=2648384 RepID=UPI003D1E89AE
MKLRNITKFYGEDKIFEQFSLDIPEDEITVILGASGVGKTTLMNIISGEIEEYTGEVIFENENNAISYIFQEEALIQWKTVFENVEFVLKNKISKDAISEVILKYLNLVKLDQYKDYYPRQLSGGMKRRLSIARAFAYPSKYLLMDEPFEFLDLKIKEEILDDFIKMQEIEKKTVVFVTHDIELAAFFGDNIVILNRDNKNNYFICNKKDFNRNFDKLKEKIIEYI